jgi:hypothetical protein
MGQQQWLLDHQLHLLVLQQQRQARKPHAACSSWVMATAQA